MQVKKPRNLILAKDNRCGTLFRLNASSFCNFSNVTNNFVSCKLWHHRMGHVGEKGLKTLINKKMVDGLSGYSVDFDNIVCMESNIEYLLNLEVLELNKFWR